MESTSKSSEKRPVKVTYAHKRRPSAKVDAVEASEVSGSEPDLPRALDNSERTNERRKHVDPLNLPGPEPRAKRVGSKESLGGKKVGSPHAPRTPGRSSKPPSTFSSKISLTSKQRFGTPDSDGLPLPPASDVSDKENTSRGARTTEAERRAYLESHHDVAELEPHRVLCRCCNKWLKLSATQNYALAPWKLHKKACTSDKPCTKKSRRSMDFVNVTAASGAEDDDASSIAPSISASDATGVSNVGRHRSSADRQRLLEEDELSGEVRADAVFCSACAKWVKLSNRSAYQLKNWTIHTKRVHGRPEGSSRAERGGDTPSSRVREAERKLQLVNDSQARDSTASRVTCGVCAAEVKLSETVPYQLDNWVAHKAVCPILTSAAESQSATGPQGCTSKRVSVVSTGSSALGKAHAASSTTSTDATCVARDGTGYDGFSFGHSVIGQKRQRDEDEPNDNSKAVRARTSSYIVPDMKPSGPWGWLKLPWETFKRGFAEGLGAGRGEVPKKREVGTEER